MILDMSRAEHYDIAAAIRGPDNLEWDSLKQAFTFPIRYVVTEDSDWNINIHHSYYADSLRIEEIDKALRANPPGLIHYLDHLAYAARWLGLTHLAHSITFRAFTQDDWDTIWAEAEALVAGIGQSQGVTVAVSENQ